MHSLTFPHAILLHLNKVCVLRGIPDIVLENVAEAGHLCISPDALYQCKLHLISRWMHVDQTSVGEEPGIQIRTGFYSCMG